MSGVSAQCEAFADACLGPVPRGVHWERKRRGFHKVTLSSEYVPHWIEKRGQVESGGQFAQVVDVDHVQKTVVLWYGE